MNEVAFSRKADRLVDIEFRAGGAPRVVVRGDVDFRRAPEIREAIANLLEQGRKRVDVHLADVVFMDSSGISALLDSVRLARENNARLVLVSPTRQLMHLLEVSGFEPLFEFEQLPSAVIPPVPRPVRPSVYWQMSEFSVPCDPELVADIRHRVAQIADSMPFTAEEIEDVKLAVGEAATNAFRYGCPGGRADSIRVRCIGDSGALTVEITDSGAGFDPGLVPQPALGSLEMGGRGLFFMKLAMDEVDFRWLDKGTCVRMVKHVKAPPPPAGQ